MLGKGIPTATTALALSSVKSSPSLTLPLHTAISSAPSISNKRHTAHAMNREHEVGEGVCVVCNYVQVVRLIQMDAGQI